MSKAQAQPNIYVVILTGLPGCGKSTFATSLEKFGWIRINQDDLGDADQCRVSLRKALKHGKSILLDRCNVHAKERKMWIQEAKATLGGDGKAAAGKSKPGKGSSSSSAGAKTKKLPEVYFESVFFDVSVEECKARALARRNHPTLAAENVDKVIDEFARGLKPPEPWEGFTKVMRVTSNEESAALVRALRDYPVDPQRM